jgi:hypothetical protein
MNRIVVMGALVVSLAARTGLALESRPEDGHSGTGTDVLFLQVDGHISFINDDPSRSLVSNTFGFGLRTGWRFSGWAGFLHLERNLWVSSDIEGEIEAGVLNLGLGAERLYFGSMGRSSITLGTSTLLFDTLFHQRGTTGLFLDIRPFGFRFEVLPGFFIDLDPIAFSLVAPVLGDPSIVLREYRLILGVEVVL